MVRAAKINYYIVVVFSFEQCFKVYSRKIPVKNFEESSLDYVKSKAVRLSSRNLRTPLDDTHIEKLKVSI